MEPDNNNIFPRVRPDLHFSIQEKEGEGYIIEDPLKQKFYRIGKAEYILFTQLDGQTALCNGVARANSILGEEVFNDDNSKVTLQWLIQNQLLADSSDELVAGRMQLDERIRKQKMLGKLNLISVKIPLVNPDPFFEKISPWLRWLTGPFFGLVWVATLLYGITLLYQQADAFFTAATGTLSPGNVFFLWFAWFVLKILHEASHALTTYRYHGRVFEAGILFIVFFPLTYVNGSSTWNFPNRWQRIHAAFAGIYAELFVAAVAVIIWAENPNSVVGNIAHNVVIVAGFSSLLFNINPLMRFDGYFILSDLTAIPNLYTRGKNFVSSVFIKIFFGDWRYIPRFTVKQEAFIACYGFASWVWRLLVMSFLLLLVASAIHGFGIFIAIISFIMIVGIPLWRLRTILIGLYNENRAAFRRFWLVTGLCGCLTVVALNLFYWEKPLNAPAVVQYENELVVKAKVAGFVDSIYVQSGQKVEEGQILIELRNPDIQAELEEYKLRLDKVLLQKRNAIIREDVTSYQVLEEQSLVARHNIAALEEDIADLRVVAETGGTVLAHRLDELQGVYLTRGKEIMSLVTENDKKLIASINQEEIESFQKMVGKPLKVIKRTMGRTTFTGTVTHVSPRADQSIPDDALSAAYGGPIAVRMAQASGMSGKSARGAYEFFYPHFLVEIEVPPVEADKLLVGQITTIRIAHKSVSLYVLIKKQLVDYFTRKLSGRVK